MEDQPADICYLTLPIMDTQQRTEFFPTHCQVKAYPSMGGVVIGLFTAVQLKHLGLSNVKPAPRSHNETDEDGLALGMMRQGAHWWPSWQFYVRHYDRLDAQMPVGYAENDPVKPYLERMPEDLDAHVNMALNADERCEVLKSFSAKFYDTVEECEDIPKTLEEGYQRGKRNEHLLKKMDDGHYQERWLEHGMADTPLGVAKIPSILMLQSPINSDDNYCRADMVQKPTRYLRYLPSLTHLAHVKHPITGRQYHIKILIAHFAFIVANTGMRLSSLTTAARAWNPSKHLTRFQRNQIIHQGRFNLCLILARQTHDSTTHSPARSQEGGSAFKAFAAMADAPPTAMEKPKSPRPKPQGKRPAPQNHKSGQGKKRQQKKMRKRERDMKTGSTEEVLAFDIRHLRESLNETENGAGTPAADESLPEPGSEILVKVVELSSTGDALALQEGSKRIYVLSFAVPGDTVKVKVYRHLREEGYTVADFISVVEPAPTRDDARLRAKRRIVEKAFRNFSELPPELIPAIQDTIGSPLQYGYRTKLTPHFDGPGGNRRKNTAAFTERPDIGFMLKGTRKTMDIEDCPIGTDAVRAGMKTERERMAAEFAKYKRGATVLLRESTLRAPKEKDGLESAGAPSAGAVRVEADTYVDWKTCITDNNGTSTEYVGDYVFHNPAGSFFQNNNSILPVFTDYIRQHILPTQHPGSIKYLIDAYSGSGLFTITLSSLFQGSTGIDIAEKSIEFARTNAAANNLPESQANFIAADAGQLFKSVRYDPDETVARDVGMLVRGETGSADADKANDEGTRYEIESLRGFDFFPQTGHVEGVAVLNRVDAGAAEHGATAPETVAE
ncbi:hypothetical protein CHU98_g10578 [Xylaria longipes]|nr:hypothetical protein CHU98_g10578 [Xylaria longipes]